MRRIRSLQKKLSEKKVDAALISCPENIRYLCGFSGTNGRLLITPKKATLITDFRYLLSAKKQLPAGVAVYDQKAGLKKLFRHLRMVGVEEAHLTHAQFVAHKKAFGSVRLRPFSGVVEEMRMIKGEGEIRIIKKAVRLAVRAFGEFAKTIRVGQSEDEMEWNLLTVCRRLGADGFSFPPIITFGKNTADVHHQKEAKKLKKGECVLVDFGIRYHDYATDMTRVIFTKPPTQFEQKIYSIVHQANRAAIKAIKVGRKMSVVDSAARTVIEKAGYGDHFGHSTGHGIGLEVHEMPNVSEKSTTVIRPGMVFTIEPGIYIEGKLGVRLEDMVYVRPDGGVEVLTKGVKKMEF